MVIGGLVISPLTIDLTPIVNLHLCIDMHMTQQNVGALMVLKPWENKSIAGVITTFKRYYLIGWLLELVMVPLCFYVLVVNFESVV